ncbi:hypothetical protein FRC11_001420, partial [Ceratobasidium sp. 423]
CYLVDDTAQELDKEGEELSPNAQVWKTYVKEAGQVDEELVDGWNKSMDAGLFSAISATFAIETYKNLKPDPADISAQTLLSISQALWSFTNGSQPTIPSPFPGTGAVSFQASASAIWVNVLLFSSLSISLAVATLTMFAKEWISDFMSERTGPSSVQARQRQQQWEGVVKWRMDTVLMVLPVMFRISMLLFAVGICVFLWDVHHRVALAVIVVTALGTAIFAVCAICHALWEYCPYTTVVSRIFRQHSSLRLQDKRDEPVQDEVTGKALHWMIVNCEAPRSVDVALQSLAAGDEKISPTMLERCDAWTLVRQRLESVENSEEQAEAVCSIYKRALRAHLPMREHADGLRYRTKKELEQLAALILGVQSCINCVIHKLLERLSPSGRNRAVLEQCKLIGPRLLEFEYEVYRFRGSEENTGQARTWWRGGSLKYNRATHLDRTETLLGDIIRLLEQHMRREIDIEREFQCILCASLVVLLCGKMAESSYKTAGGYLQRLILAQKSRDGEDTSNQTPNQRASDEFDKTTLDFLIGVVPISNSTCCVENSPCFSDSPSDGHTNLYHQAERVFELVWKYLISSFYLQKSYSNKGRYLIHGGLHLIARADDYGLTSEDCLFIANRMDCYQDYHPSEIDGRCLAQHIKEFPSTLATNIDPSALSPQLLTCMAFLSTLPDGTQYLHTPELYVFTLDSLCQKQVWCSNGLGQLMVHFPFPKASPRLVDTLSKSGVIHHLVNLLESHRREQRAFATAQLWLFFNMSIQASDRISPALSTLEKMLLQYQRLRNNPENQEEVAEELETRLMGLMDQELEARERVPHDNLIKYLYRVLECMLQQRYTPLPKLACNNLRGIPERLRGIASFVDLETELLDPSANNTVPPPFSDSNQDESD